MSTSPRRPASPTWGRGRDLLLTAAADLFARQGYEATTTREIAEHAGVSEQMVFRHFGSKAKLFETAAVAPFAAHFDRYVAEWKAQPSGVRDPVEECTALYRGLYEVFAANRALLSALLTFEHGPEAGTPDAVAAAIGPALESFADLLATEQAQRGFRTFDVRIVVRIVAGLVMAHAVFGELLYATPDGPPPPDVEAVIHEMAMLTIYGAWPPPSDR